MTASAIPRLNRRLCARLAPPAEEPERGRDRRPPTPRTTPRGCPENGEHRAGGHRARAQTSARYAGLRALSVGVEAGLLPPSVVLAGGLGRVARLTQRLQVRLVMGATIFERDDVVDLLGRGDAPVLLAVFAQRVGLDVGVAYLAPAVVVALVDRRITLIRPITLILCFGVSRAESVVGEFGAAGLGAGAFRFPRHHPHLP